MNCVRVCPMTMRVSVNHAAPSSLRAFDFPSRTRVIFGAGSASRAGDAARELGARHVLLVTDAGLVAAGHAERARENLKAAGLRVTLFGRAKENPTTKCVGDVEGEDQAGGVCTII